MRGRGDRLARKASCAGSVLVARARRFRRQRQKRRAPVVEQPVQHQTQRIDVGLHAVGLVVVDLRRHVLVGARLRAADRALGGLGDAEIAQLIRPVRRDEDVLRLDVPVQDVPFFAESQRAAEIRADPDDLLVRDLFSQRPGQRREQLHLDEDVPAHAVVVLDVAHVVAVDDVGAALHVGHQGILAHDVLQIAVEARGDAFLVVAVAEQILYVALVLGDRDELQRGLFLVAEDVPLDLVHGAEAAAPDHAHGLPSRPDGFVVHHVFSVVV